MNSMAESAVGRVTALAVLRRARAKDLPAFADGKCIVYVFSDPWESELKIPVTTIRSFPCDPTRKALIDRNYSHRSPSGTH